MYAISDIFNVSKVQQFQWFFKESKYTAASVSTTTSTTTTSTTTTTITTTTTTNNNNKLYKSFQ